MMWINKGSRNLYELSTSQQFFDSPSPFPPELEQLILAEQEKTKQLISYLENVYTAHRERRDWQTVEIPAWLKTDTAPASSDESPSKPAKRA